MTERDELILSHLPLVAYIARSICRRVPLSVEYDDMRSAGICGLLQAAESYHAERGIPFGTYAKYRIRGAMLDELRKLDQLSRGQRQAVRGEEARQPQTLSLQQPGRGDDPAPDPLHRFLLPPAQGSSAERSASVAECREKLVRAIRTLSPRYRRLLAILYGEQKTQKEASLELGVNESRVSQMHTLAMKRLRQCFSEGGIRELLIIPPIQQ